MRNLAMLALLCNLLATLRSALRTRTELALENLAFRQPLATLRRSSSRPRLRLTALGVPFAVTTAAWHNETSHNLIRSLGFRPTAVEMAKDLK